MGKEYTVQEALRMAIKAEKESRDFYLKAGSVTRNARARKVFGILAGEEEQHLEAFFGLYHGDEFGDLGSYLLAPPDKSSPSYVALKKAIDKDTHEQKALEIALQEEKSIIDRYSEIVQDIVDPLVRGIFDRVIRETRKHYEIIESEYAFVMRMVHESDQDIFVRE